MLTNFCRVIGVGCVLAITFSQIVFTIPRPTGLVKDYTGTLQPQEIVTLNQLGNQLRQKTGVEAVMVVVPKLNGQTIEDAAVDIFEKWGIGQKDKDNGILFLTDLGNQKVRIEVGYGLEGILPDGLTGQLLDQYVIPYFKTGNIRKGLANGYVAVLATVAKAHNVQLTNAPSAQRQRQSRRSSPLSWILPIIILFLLFGGKRRGSMLPLVLLMMLGGGGRGGGFGSFGGSGGFGGFGGGLSGGGGSSRGW